MKHFGRISTSILVILGLALATRCFFLYKNWNNLDFAESYLLHGEVARNILKGHWFQKNPEHLQALAQACREQGKLLDLEDFPPPQDEHLVPLYNDEGGYGLLLSAIWKILGSQRWWPIRLIQILIDTLMCWLIFRIGQMAFGERVGVLAALLYAFFIPAVEMAVRPHRDIWVNFLYITSVYVFLVSGQREKPFLLYFLLGLFAGVIAWMRSTVVPFVLFTTLLLFLLYHWKVAAKLSLAILTGFLLVFSTLIVRNYLAFDTLMVTRGAFWHSFWGGMGQMENPYGLREDDTQIAMLAKKLDPTVEFETDRYEQVLKQEALKFVSEHPLWYAGSVLKRGLMIVFPKAGRKLFFQEPLPQHVSGTLNRSVNEALLIAADIFLGGLFLWGLWQIRGNVKKLAVLVHPYFFTLATLAPFYVTGRNIANVYFVVLIIASYAFVTLIDKRMQRRIQ